MVDATNNSTGASETKVEKVGATNNQIEASETEIEKADATNNPFEALKIKIKLDFNKLRPEDNDKSAISGEATFLDFNRMDFVINGKTIDSNFIIAFKEGAKDYKNELFNRDDIDKIPEESKAFFEPMLKELDQSRLPKVWEEHCKDPEVDDEKKTNEYKKKFERFYNAGLRVNHLFLKKDYRSLTKEIFKEIFTYAGAEIPNDSILEELVTNCNQVRYCFAPFMEVQGALGKSFMVGSNKKTMNINYTSSDNASIKFDNAKIRFDTELSVSAVSADNIHTYKIGDLPSSLEFTLESAEDKHVTYKDGILSLTIPEELKNHQKGDKNLFDILKEYFKQFCEKLGFKLKVKEEAKIKHNLGDSLTVNSRLESVEFPPLHVNHDKPAEKEIKPL
ncbi:MAG: hypothetical protein PG981_000931 [Wolbachia endosymbiont of Ctenocephalides orientis wCori]|nr:MAG: hypothetical protein PG981_000931 [Wolbachia endosymbiont of Ctenocephalides orientis wCori]